MQEQINAIKQLLKTNNAIAESIDQCIVKWAGESASWEQAATFKTAEEFAHEDNRDGLDPVFKVLWRSRIDLNNARINAEEVDLDDFLGGLVEDYNDITLIASNPESFKDGIDKSVNDVLSNELDEIDRLSIAIGVIPALLEKIAGRDRTISHMDTEIDSLRMDVKERDRRVSSLKTQIRGFEAALELAKSKAIAPNLDAFKSAVDEAVNPALLKKIDERDLTISKLNTDAIDTANVIAELDDKLDDQDRQIDNLKSHFEVTLKAIAMNLNALKGARKPDETKEVNGVMTTFRNYDDNLTHHHKTIIIENVQRAIAEEAKKLKGANLKDFSFDEAPF
jgi:predicted RNase H-like nuclease (RuvC/YqgF family)